jgi:hypothetical protein
MNDTPPLRHDRASMLINLCLGACKCCRSWAGLQVEFR